MKCNKKDTAKGISWVPDDICNRVHQTLKMDLPIGETDTLQYSVMSPEQVSAFRQVTEFKKKFLTSTSNPAKLKRVAVRKFLARVRDLRSLQLPNLEIDRKVRPSSVDKSVWALHRARAVCHEILGTLDAGEWFMACKHGKGVTLGTRFERSASHDKFNAPLTCTAELVGLLRFYKGWDHHFEYALSASANTLVADIVPASRTTTVDKDDRSARMIAIEPTANMFFQQGLMAVMTKRLRPYLDIKTLPDHHQKLAFIGSLTGTLSTIDFASASDSVSLELVRWLLPPDWFYALCLVRCGVTKIKGKYIQLPMISTMGNATTFPLETLVFYSLAIATCTDDASVLPDWEKSKDVSVFGDDCIVPTYSTSFFISLAEKVGFVVNHEKSFFSDEGFRESCGGDFHLGRDVRPFSIKAPIDTRSSTLAPWLYVVFNSVLKKYNSHFGSLVTPYTATMQGLVSLFDEFGIIVKIVPEEYPDDSGCKVWRDYRRYGFRRVSRIRVDKHGTATFQYHRFVYRAKEEYKDERHYWYSIKFPCGSEFDDVVPYTRPKRKGGYVVAKGRSYLPLG